MDEHGERVRRAAATYSSASDHYLRPALGFWDRYGTATVQRLGLRPGQAVADLCCGAGASAIPAARAVGPDGRVVAVDAAAPMVELTRDRAAREGLANVAARQGDATATGLPDASFDAVVCVFGVFFVPDMPGFVAEMWRLVRPGGTVAVTTWGAGVFEPGNSLFWAAVGRQRPDLVRGFNPWDEITTGEAVVRLFARAGITPSTASEVAGWQAYERPEEFWDIVLGTGYRATVDAMADPERAALREDLLTRLRDDGINQVRTDVVYGTATKPL